MPPSIPVVLGSALLRGRFVMLTIALYLLFVAMVYVSARRSGIGPMRATRQAMLAAILAFLWIAATGIPAAHGELHMWAPPTMGPVLIGMLLIAIGVALSPLGGRIVAQISIAALVGYQGFRVLVELLLHRAYVEGVAPIQMTYSGRNFDLVTGITAILLGAWLATGRRSRRLVLAWNVLGTLLLANIVVVALLSAPTPFRVFMNEPANTFITRVPWVWLPAVMVLAAVMGHVLVFRWLAQGENVRMRE
ncbi:MAG TPA: hypothetical protein VF461_21295 [Gemmatimonadaceae bacterium]